jgi:hypothetical protein
MHYVWGVNQFALWHLVDIHSMSQKEQYHGVKSTFFFFNFVKMLEWQSHLDDSIDMVIVSKNI